MKLPKHIAFSLQHNENATVYETVKQLCENDDPYYKIDNWVSPEQYVKAIETNEIWTVHFYPNSPVGFHVLHAADFEVLLKALEEFE